MMKEPKLIVMSSPSGGGKSTLCDRLLEEVVGIEYSISCTTRPSRGSEVDGEDYFFVSDDDFDARLKQGLFLEHAVVHDYKYGTLKSTVEEILACGDSVLMDIDVQGAEQIRNYAADVGDDDIIGRAFIDIFITPPSIEALKMRLEGRGEDSKQEIEKRVNNAQSEMNCQNQYMYVIVNEDIDNAYKDMKEILGIG